MSRRPPRSTLTDTLFPYTTLFRSDPDIGVLVALWRRGVPMRGRNLLNPLDPDGVVDVAELVDGVGGGGEGEGEGFHGCDHSKPRSEEHTSELQSLMRISYAVFSLKNKK